MKPKSAFVVLRVVSVHMSIRMKSHKPVYIILFLSLTLLGSNAWPDEKIASTVAINPNRTLSWDDFKVVNVINGKSTINAICLSTCEVEILKITPKGKQVSLDVKAIVEHQPELSQVTERFLANNDAATKSLVLHHENGHFLIAQIIGHRIAKDAQDYAFDPKNYKVQLNQIIKRHFRSWNQMDQLYDMECTNPRNPVMQKKWDDYFEKELNKFKLTSN